MTTPQADEEGRRPLALIVDDAATVRMYHRGLAEDAGWRVVEAENGVEALEKVLDAPVDLMLVDVNMPTMDGYRFIAEARRTESLGAAPAVMISTECQPVDAERAFAAGANHYLVKPARPEALEAILTLLRPGDRP